MEIILHLQNLSPVATHMDIRHFFVGLDIPEGGVQIVGGKDGDSFINFRSEQDLLRALTFDNQPLLGQCVKLFLAKEIDVQRVIEKRTKELDRAKANFLLASSHTAYADDVKSFHDPVRPSRSHRAYADDQDRPSSSQRDADGDDRLNVQNQLSNTDSAYTDEDERFQDQDLSSSSYRPYAVENETDPDQNPPTHHFLSDDLSLDPTNPFDQAVKQLLEKKSSQRHSYHETSGRSHSSRETSGCSHSSHDISGQDHSPSETSGREHSSSVKSHSEKRSWNHSRDRHHSSHSNKKLKQKGEEHQFDMSPPFYALVAQRDFKKKQEGEAKKQKTAPTKDVDVPPWLKRPQSDGLGIADNGDHDNRHMGDGRSRDKDDRPGSLRDSSGRDSTKGKGNSSKNDKTRRRQNSREKDSLRGKHDSRDSNRTRDQRDKSKDKDKRGCDKGVRTSIPPKKVRKRERETEKDSSGDRRISSTKLREDTPRDESRKTSDKILTRTRKSSRDIESDSMRQHHTVERKDRKLDYIGLYNLDVTVTATDIRKFLKPWEIPDGGIILRTDKFDPTAILAYITYYPKENVEVKTLIGTVLHGRPVEIKSVPLELFDREKVSDQMIEETPSPAPAPEYPNYPPPYPAMYPGPMWMPQMPMPMPGYGPRPGMMGPLRGMMLGMMPTPGMGPPPWMPPPFPRPPFPGCDSAQGPDSYGSALYPGHLGPFTPPGMMPLHYIWINSCVLPLHCSACEVWSWFDGPHGPTEHAILVTTKKGKLMGAFVAFLDERQRDQEKALRKDMKGRARSHAEVDQKLSHMSNKMVILQSNESGVDTDITGQMRTLNQDLYRNRIQQQRPQREPERNRQRQMTSVNAEKTKERKKPTVPVVNARNFPLDISEVDAASFFREYNPIAGATRKSWDSDGVQIVHVKFSTDEEADAAVKALNQKEYVVPPGKHYSIKKTQNQTTGEGKEDNKPAVKYITVYRDT